MNESSESSATQPEPPPPLGAWRNLYLLLAAELAVLVLLFFALTRWAQ